MLEVDKVDCPQLQCSLVHAQTQQGTQAQEQLLEGLRPVAGHLPGPFEAKISASSLPAAQKLVTLNDVAMLDKLLPHVALSSDLYQTNTISPARWRYIPG